MPELTVIHIGLLALMLGVGAIIGWVFRADRCAKEKIAVNATWQDQIESQQSEHNRLAEQNRSLMEQIAQYQASQKDYANRAKELSESLKEAFARRDELQRQLKDARGNLEVAIAQRDRLRNNQPKNSAAQSAAIKEKDDKIFKLSRELTSWQSRVPPLVERFQEKSKEAAELEDDLEKAQSRLQALEELVRSDQTRIEPVDADSLPDGGDASNEPNAMTSTHETAVIQDQIDGSPDNNVVSVDAFTETVHDENDEDDDEISEDQEFGAVFSDSDGDDAETADSNGSDAEFDAVFDSETTDEASPADPDDVGDAEEAAPAEGDQENDHQDDDHQDDDHQDDQQDNLKMIKGIGPAIEKTLNDLGVFRFHQIAEMSEYDIDRVAQQLKGFRSRIYREDWIGQARDLQYEKSNDRS